MAAPSLAAALLLLAMVCGAAAEEAQPADEGSFPGTINCYFRGTPAVKPRSLTFCHKFNDKSCCTPVTDVETNDYFDELTNLGLSCRLRGDVREHPMAKLYCLLCDPQQPSYVRNEPYVPICDGDNCPTPGALYQYYPGDVFIDEDDHPGNVNATSEQLDSLKDAELEEPDDVELVPSSERKQTILICKDWAESAFGVAGESSFMSRFSSCGLLVSSPCLDAEENIIPERSRYICGDDLVLPGIAFSSIEEFLNANSIGPFEMSDDFGFALVENRPCTDADLAEPTTALLGGNRKNGEYDRFFPDCLRTVAQLQGPTMVSAWSLAFDSGIAELTANTDEKCFNSAAGVAPFVGLVLLSLLAAVFAL